MKNIRIFYLILFFHFLVVKFSVYLNRHVFRNESVAVLLCWYIDYFRYATVSCHHLFPTSSLDVSRRLCVVIVAFLE